MEQWAACPDFEGYEVSDHGNVRRDGRVLNLLVHNRGYRMVSPSVGTHWRITN